MSQTHNPAEFRDVPSVVSEGGNNILSRTDRIALLAEPRPATPITADPPPMTLYDSQAASPSTIMASRFPLEGDCNRSGLRYPLQEGECDPRGPYPRPAEGTPTDSVPPTPRPVFPPPFYPTPGTEGIPIGRPGVPRDGSVPIGAPGVPRGGKTTEPGIKIQ